MSTTILRNVFIAISLSVALTACGSGSSSSHGSDDNPIGSIPGPTQPPADDNDGTLPPVQQPDSEPEPEPTPTPQPNPDPKPDPGQEPAPEPGPTEPQPSEPAPAKFSVLLQWEAPTTRVDDSCLADLTAYRISYGNSPNHYPQTIDIPAEELACKNSGTNNSCGSVQTCNYLVENLESTTWHFVMQAIDSNGNVSDYSGEAIKTVQ